MALRFKSSTARKRRPTAAAPVAPKTCYFCDEGIGYLDYKNVRLIEKYLSRYMRIEPRRRTGACAKHQRQLANALKRARHLALAPFVIH